MHTHWDRDYLINLASSLARLFAPLLHASGRSHARSSGLITRSHSGAGRNGLCVRACVLNIYLHLLPATPTRELEISQRILMRQQD